MFQRTAGQQKEEEMEEMEKEEDLSSDLSVHSWQQV